MSGDVPVLLATTIFVLQEGGHYKQFYRGDAVPGLNEEQVERLTKCGALGKASDVEPQAVEDDSEVGADVVPAEDGSKPDEDATKADLIEWLVENAVDADGADYTASKLQPLNKAALWELINAVED